MAEVAVMTLSPARIKAAARAMSDQFGFDWDFMSDEWRGDYEDIAAVVLACAFPDLTTDPPTAWLAPITPTDAMLQAASGGPFELAADYAAMRTAHLKEDNPGGKKP